VAAPRWHPESKDAVLAALAERPSIKGAAAKLGIAQETLRRWAAENEVELPQGGRPAINAQTESAHTRVERETREAKLKRERDELRDLYKVAREKAAALDERLEETIAIAATVGALPPPDFRATESQSDHLPERSVIADVSDIQGGQKVQAKDTGGSIYNWDITQWCAQHYVKAVVSSVRNIMRSYRVTDFTFNYGGDEGEGWGIFPGQNVQLCLNAAEQTVYLGQLCASIEKGIMEGLPEVKTWRRRKVLGNHGKPGGRGSGAEESTFNWEWIFWHYLLAYAQNLPFKDSEIATHGRIRFEVAGQPFISTHGDEIQGQMGIPWYGVYRMWSKHEQELGRGNEFRYWLFHHWHQVTRLTYGDGAAFCNGDWVGPNNMTGRLKNPASTPQQCLYFVSRERGVDEVSYIDLSRSETALECAA
jgi:transposase-like protein